MRILINQLKNIGDVLLATSAIALVKQKYPDARITLMTVPRVAPFFENHPLIDEVLPLAYQSKNGSFSSMLNMVKKIKERNFDISISLDTRLRPLLLTFFARIPVRIAGIGMDAPVNIWYRFLYTHKYHITTQGKEHQSETCMKVVRPYLQLAETVSAKPSLADASEESNLRMRNLLHKENDNKKILFCVRGTHPEKNWPPEYFAGVITEITNKYEADCFIIGARDDFDYASSVIEKCRCNVTNICGMTKPNDLVALFNCADLLVSVDTGLAHIAATTDIQIVSIFLCTNPVQWHPLSQKASVLCYNFAFSRFGLKPAAEFITQEEILPLHVIQEIERHIK
ncbi:MAG: glycosyltransferase family 9 protein [Acidaminococcaceae bacterium]